MVLNRSQVEDPKLPQQVEPVPELGGDVIVRGLLLSARMELDDINEKAKVPLEGETDEEARIRAGKLVVPRMLNATVVDDEGHPIFTIGQWDVFGGAHRGTTFRLFEIALRMSGRIAEEVRKN
jgi:hypothetical protein